MATVLDEFVLLIGLDPSRFEEGRRALEAQFEQAKEGVARFGDNVEAHGKKITEIFGLTRTGVVGLLSAFIGTEAAQFVDRVATMDARTMQLAHSIGTSTRELSLWQNMVRAVGGEAADAGATLAGLNDAFMNMRMGTGMPSPAFASLLSRAGVDFRTATPGNALNQIMGFLGGQNEQTQRFFLQQVPGMNESMMFLLMEIMRHPDKMRNLREELEKLGLASDKSGQEALTLAERTGELRTAWEALARALFPILTGITNFSTTLIRVLSGLGQFGLQLFNDALGSHPGAPTSIAPETRGDRNNNPGNIEFGPFAQAHGATGSDGRFAIFPTPAAGESAMMALLHDRYQGLTLSQIQRRWVGNADTGYLGAMSAATGLRPGDVPNLNDPAVLAALVRGMMQGEGTHHIGRAGAPAAVNRQSSVNIGTINVSSSKADPAAVAAQIPEAMKRYSMLAGINTGLT